jgi:hypothetical protein
VFPSFIEEAVVRQDELRSSYGRRLEPFTSNDGGGNIELQLLTFVLGAQFNRR